MRKSRRIILSCEHAGNTVPAQYKSLFKDCGDILSTHCGYDIGIAPVADTMQTLLGSPLCRYDKTRLLIDVNRTKKKSLFSEFSRSLPDSEKQHLIRHYYMPYRDRLYQRILEQDTKTQVLHLSLHSFTPTFNGRTRKADIGILYDPARKEELRLACDLQRTLTLQTGLHIRRNYPYLGRSDGMTSWLRKQFSRTRYLGLEIEFNQDLLGSRNPGDLSRQVVEAIGKIEQSFR